MKQSTDGSKSTIHSPYDLDMDTNKSEMLEGLTFAASQEGIKAMRSQLTKKYRPEDVCSVCHDSKVSADHILYCPSYPIDNYNDRKWLNRGWVVFLVLYAGAVFFLVVRVLFHV